MTNVDLTPYQGMSLEVVPGSTEADLSIPPFTAPGGRWLADRHCWPWGYSTEKNQVVLESLKISGIPERGEADRKRLWF